VKKAKSVFLLVFNLPFLLLPMRMNGSSKTARGQTPPWAVNFGNQKRA
jgi:hypothetical protein